MNREEAKHAKQNQKLRDLGVFAVQICWCDRVAMPLQGSAFVRLSIAVMVKGA